MIGRLALLAAVAVALGFPQSTAADHCGPAGHGAVPAECARG